MCLSTCHSFRHLYPPVGVRLCPPRLVRHLQILMHMVLGSPWWLIEMRNPSSPTVTQTVTPTPLTAAPCGGGLLCASQKENRNHGPQNARTEMATSLVTRTVTEITTGIVIGPKRVITDMVQIGLVDALHNAKTTMVSTAVMASTRDHAGMRVHSTAAKQSRDAGVSTSPSHGRKKSHTPEHRPLPPPPMFHSTPSSRTSQIVFWPHLCTLVLQSKSELASSPWLRGGWRPSHLVHAEHANPGKHSIHSRSHITICVSLRLESHCRSHQTNLQSGLWRGDTWRSGLRGSSLGFPAKRSCSAPRLNPPATSR